MQTYPQASKISFLSNHKKCTNDHEMNCLKADKPGTSRRRSASARRRPGSPLPRGQDFRSRRMDGFVYRFCCERLEVFGH